MLTTSQKNTYRLWAKSKQGQSFPLNEDGSGQQWALSYRPGALLSGSLNVDHERVLRKRGYLPCPAGYW